MKQPELSMQYVEVDDHKKADYNQFFSLLLKKWKILLISTILGFSIAYLYTKSITPLYKLSATILIRDQSEELTQSPDFLTGINLFATNRNFFNEISRVNSYPIVFNVLSSLNFEVSYFEKEWLSTSELYLTSPFIVVFSKGFPQPTNLPFKIRILSETEYQISAKGKEIALYSFEENKVTGIIENFKIKKIASFGDTISTDYCQFKIIRNSNFELKDVMGHKYFFAFSNLADLANFYKNEIAVNQNNIQSTTATLEIFASNTDKGTDFLNSLIREFMNNNLVGKNYMANATISYINDQLQQISDSLSNVERKLQDFRRRNQVLNLSTKAEQVYAQIQTLETNMAEVKVRQRYYLYIKEQFDNQKDISDLVAPSSMGIEDPLLGNLVQSFIELNAEKNTLIENNQERSPYLRNLEIKMNNLRNTIYENINYHLGTIDINLKDFEERSRSLNAELSKLPETERKLLGIERDFNLNDEIYTFLMQRRAEAQIILASNLPNIEIIEPSMTVGNDPVLPKKKINYLLGAFLGFIIPSIFYILLDLSRNVIHSDKELKHITNIPVLGHILHKTKSERDNVVLINPKLPVVESFRKILPNLNYFSKGANHLVILVTSSISGEGKSFCAYNLASMFALNQKKTLLIGFDLRKTSFYDNLKFTTNLGTSTLLTNQTLLADTIQSTSNEFLKVIPPGPIPPNPAELISSEETGKMLNELKQLYDIVIVDTPPMGILVDAYHLIESSDIKIFVVRLNTTPRSIFVNTIQDLENKKIRNMTILINDYSEFRGTYDSQYKSYVNKKNDRFNLRKIFT